MREVKNEAREMWEKARGSASWSLALACFSLAGLVQMTLFKAVCEAAVSNTHTQPHSKEGVGGGLTTFWFH